MIRPACLLLTLAAWAPGRAADGLQALRDTAVPSAAAGLPYAEVLHEAGLRAEAERLRLGLLDAHVAALEGRPWPAPRRLGEVMDGGGDPVDTRARLAERWNAVFPALGTLRWGGTTPPMLAGMQPAPVELAAGAWAAPAANGEADLIAVLQWRNLGPTPLTQPSLQVAVSVAGTTRVFLVCNPLAGRPDDAVAPQAERGFLCRGRAPTDETPLFTRAARGTLAAGERLELRPMQFRAAGGLDDLAAAIGSATPLDRAAWVTRLVGVPLPAVASAATTTNPAPASAAARPAPPPRAKQPPPPSALRPALAVAGSAAFLLLMVRLVLGHLDEETPARTVLRTLPWALGLMALALVLGSSAGQQALLWATGPGLKQFALALQQTNDAAPAGWSVGGLLGRAAGDGMATLALVLGVGLFALERLAERSGVPALYARSATLVLRAVLCAPGLLAVSSASATIGPLPALFLGIGALAPFVASWFVTLALRKGFGVLDDEDLGWLRSIGRAWRGSAGFTGTATRGEFWGPVMAWVLASLLASGLWSPALPWVFWGLLLPLPALAVRRLRGLDEGETEELGLWAVGWLRRWAVRRLRQQQRRL